MAVTASGVKGIGVSTRKESVRLQGPRYPVYAYGDRLRVHGELETPPAWEDFNYRDYLARKGIHSHVRYARVERLASGEGAAWKRAMLDVKSQAQGTIARILPEPEASLLTGILLGAEGGIPCHQTFPISVWDKAF